MTYRSGRLHWVRDLCVAGLGAGLIYLLISVVTTNPEGASLGFPFVYNTPVTPCSTPNPFNGCGFLFNPYVAISDYLVWFGLVLASIFLLRLLRRAPWRPVAPANRS